MYHVFHWLPKRKETGDVLAFGPTDIIKLLGKTRRDLPETWGHAIDVPDMTAVKWLLVVLKPALVISTPGAKMSTHEPKLEKYALLSSMSVAPTVIV